MRINIKSRAVSVYQLSLWGVLLAFSLFSILYSTTTGKVQDIFVSLITPLLITLPFFLGDKLEFELDNTIFTFISLYSIGHMLGTVYKLYYLTNWWDSLLHFCGGVVFAMLGYYLIDILNKNGNSIWAAVAFAVCFSVFVSAIWEFFEFGCDKILGTDMQMDTVIHKITSYTIGNAPGTQGEINEISNTIVNGHSLGVDGYLDIGLYDTMKDMILETGGAILFGIYALINNNKKPVFKPVTKADTPVSDTIQDIMC